MCVKCTLARKYEQEPGKNKVSPLPYLKVFECQESIQSVDSVFSKTSFPETYSPSPSPPSPQQNEKRVLRPNRKFSCLTLYFNLAIVHKIAFIICATSWKTNREYIFKTPFAALACPSVKSSGCFPFDQKFRFEISKISHGKWRVYHLQEISGNSGWDVNGTRLFGSFHWKIPGKNGQPEKVVPFSQWKFSRWKCVFHLQISRLSDQCQSFHGLFSNQAFLVALRLKWRGKFL